MRNLCGGQCQTKNTHRISIDVRNQPNKPWLAINVFIYPVHGNRLFDSRGRPSRRRIAEVVREALLSCADEQGIDPNKINAAFDGFDFDKTYFDLEWPIKVKRARDEYSHLRGYNRVDVNCAHVIAVTKTNGLFEPTFPK